MTFSDHFNRPVNNLPKNITHLTFGYAFNRSINNLPKNLTHLIFEYSSFNKSVNNLPNNLTHLFFAYDFNKPVNKLPNNLICLVLGRSFVKNINKIPKSVKELGFDVSSNIKNNIPAFVETVIINSSEDVEKYNARYVVDNLPSTIKKIKVQCVEDLDFLEKIPFDCIVTFMDGEIIDIDD